jgi:hypothetical protein
MNTNPKGLYSVFDNGLGGLDWQGWVDRYEEKYDAFIVDGFEFAPTTLNYTFAQLIASTGATALPTWVDPESPGYEAALRELSGKTGNIPTGKRYYKFNRTIINEQLQLIQRYGNAAITPEMEEIFMGLNDEGTDGLIQMFNNALTHIRNQVVSTGKFSLTSVNNPRGLQDIILDFGISASNYDTLAGDERWWTDADDHTAEKEGKKSDPILYLKNRVKWIRRTKHYQGGLKMEISQDLWDELIEHSKVQARLAARLYPTIENDTVRLTFLENNANDEQFKEIIRSMIRVDEIVIRNTYGFVEAPGTDSNGDPDIVQTRIDNFDRKNVAFIPTGRIGDIQGVQPLSIGYEPENVAYYNGGRLLLTQRANPKTKSVYIEGEFAQLCVPSVPQWMFISTVTA